MKSGTKESKESILVDVARAVGSATGKVASMIGGSHTAAAPAKSAGKLPKKNKTRMPRRQKKAALKAAATQKS